MKIIGITGPSGGGKTSALRSLRSLGVMIVDCDALYHELLTQNAEMLEAIGARFDGVVTDNVLDRKALGKIVFQDAAALLELNAITHRFVGIEVDRLLEDWAQKGVKTAAIDAIALIESGLSEKCDVVIAVTAPVDVRVQRIMERDGVSEEYARLRVGAQPPDSFYTSKCDHVLVSDCSTVEEFENKCRIFFAGLLGGTKDAGT